MNRFVPLAFVFLATLAAACAEEAAAPAPIKVAEFGDTPVVAWDTVDKWSFGGDRFHKTNRFYQPVDPATTYPWVISDIDITTWFQQDVIDGWTPSLESLIGEKWKDAKKFMEESKYGGSCHFVYVATDKKFTLYFDKGKPKEKRFECEIVPGGLESFFTEPKPEHFINVDGMKKDAAYQVALDRFKARLEWSAKTRKNGNGAPSKDDPPPTHDSPPKDDPPQK